MTLFFSIITAVFITRIPPIYRYTQLLTTFVHEIGHALFSIVTFGGVRRIKLNADTSGYAEVISGWWGGRVITTFAGYPFASFLPSFMIFLLWNGLDNIVIWILIVILSLSILLWLRDFLSLAWAVSLTTGFIIAVLNHIDLSWPLYSLMAIILIDSLSRSIVVCKLSFKNSKYAGDATDLFKMTMIPSQVWGIIFVLFSGSVVIYTTLLLFDIVPDYYSPVVNAVTTIIELIDTLKL